MRTGSSRIQSLTDPERLRRRKRLRDAKWQKALADAELSEAFNKRARESHRRPAHCEYMIDTYIKCRREALRAESPEDRARRLEQQPQFHRNYDPMTLRLLATLDAEAAAAPPAAAAEPGAVETKAVEPNPADAPAHPPVDGSAVENRATEANTVESPT